MNHLKELRNAKGVSQQIVADFLGISRQAYSNYENGNREPDFESLLKLGEFFDCSVDYILRGAPDQNNATTSCNFGGLSEIYFSLAKEAQDNEIDPDDFRAVLKFYTDAKNKRGR